MQNNKVERFQLPTPCSLSQCSLDEAGIALLHQCSIPLRTAPTLYVVINPNEFLQAKRVLKEIQARTHRNPFAPYINIRTDSKLQRHEWYLGFDQGDIEVGSVGV